MKFEVGGMFITTKNISGVNSTHVIIAIDGNDVITENLGDGRYSNNPSQWLEMYVNDGKYKYDGLSSRIERILNEV